ncbi:MAG: transposase, partial [Bacilli bacterium]
MRKVNLRMNEEYKYKVIKKLVETKGNKKAASMKIHCSLRTIDRLIIKYKENGKDGFIHKNRNRKPAITKSLEIRNQVITLYENKYTGANIKHFSELLLEHENIKVSDSAINGWLRKVG